MIRSLLALELVLCLALPARADDAQLSAALDAYVQGTVAGKGFSGSVLVSQKGRVLLKKGYGLADAEHDVANTPATKFRIGSVTKQFTAALIEQLAQEKRLAVTDPVCKWLSPCPPAWKEITLHHLLTHTAGIPNFTGFEDFSRVKVQPTTPLALLERFDLKPLEFAPGTKHRYSNSGYVVLGLVAERAGGKPYEQLLRERILAPAGLANTGYDHPEEVLPGRAHGYTRGPDGGLRNADYTDMSVPFAAGAVYSTVEDLAKWADALSGEKILSKASLAQMTTPFLDHYAYGWIVNTEWNHKVIWHNGGIDGFVANFQRYPDDGVVVVVLANDETSPADKMAKDLAGLVFGENVAPEKGHVAVQIDPKILPQYVGTYELSPTFAIAVTTAGGHLFTQATGQEQFEIFPEAEDRFFLRVVDAQLTFVRDAKREVVGMVLDQNGHSAKATRKK